MTIRVAAFFHTAEASGAELGTLRLFAELPDDIEVRAVLAADGPLVESIRAQGIDTDLAPLSADVAGRSRTELGQLGVMRDGLVSMAYAGRLARTLRARSVDLLLATSLKSVLIGIPAARLARIPVVWHVHDRIADDYLPPRVAAALRLVARFGVQAVIVNSESTAHTIPGVADLTVVYPGLSAEMLNRPHAERDSTTPVIGMLGRLSDTKGQRLFVQALPAVLAKYPTVRARIVGAALFGQDDYELHLREDIRRLGLDDVVTMVGEVTDPITEFDQFDLCVHASPTPEPFGQVISEAMARGVPVIATAAGGAVEIVSPAGVEPLGTLVPPGDVAALSAAMIAILDDPAAARETASRATEYVAGHFTAHRSAQRAADVFRRVARRPAPLAFAHDYLTQRGGAERVVLAMQQLDATAPLHTLLFEPQSTFADFDESVVLPSRLNKVAVFRRHHKLAMPLMAAVSSATKINAETVLASSSGWAHGMRVSGRKVVYCHAPARWLYQTENYLGGSPAKSPIGLALLTIRPMLRRWDRRAARSADVYAVNSTAMRDAVRAAYGIEATVVHPPSVMSTHDPQEPIAGIEPGFYLAVARFHGYKHLRETVEAFAQLPDCALVVVTDKAGVVGLAEAPANVTVCANLPEAQLRWLYANCRAVIGASFEDFGLTPVEAATFGKPTVALDYGGYRDTVIAGTTGVYFDAPTPAAIADAVRREREMHWDSAEIAKHAEKFSPERFHEQLRALLWPTA